MAKKFYAVRKGKSVGIYETWAECQAQVNGFSGADYKSFPSLDAARAYMNHESAMVRQIQETEAVAYVDGSYKAATKEFSCGVVMFHSGTEHHFSEAFSDSALAEMHNVAGELKGSEKAIQFCLDHAVKSVTIHHDYEGIAKWCTGAWQAKKPGTQAYKAFYDAASERIEIQFIKVKGHSGDQYNDMADQLARSAFER